MGCLTASLGTKTHNTLYKERYYMNPAIQSIYATVSYLQLRHWISFLCAIIHRFMSGELCMTQKFQSDHFYTKLNRLHPLRAEV